MSSCVRCGKDMPVDAHYCPNCGKSTGKSAFEEFELVKKFKNVITQANSNRIVVDDENGRTLLEIPVSAGLIGAVLAPWLVALGAIAAIATNCKIRVRKIDKEQTREPPIL